MVTKEKEVNNKIFSSNIIDSVAAEIKINKMKTIGIIMLLTLKLFCFSQIGENDFGHKVNCIRSIKKGDVDGEYLINVTIKGGVEIEETAEYKEEIPEGFSAKSLVVNDNRCISSANNGSISFKWKTGFPKYSQITMSYILVNNSSNSDTIKLSRSYLKYLSHEGSQGIYNGNITHDNYTSVIKKISDNDGDGIYNDRDECPDYFGKKETNGCPDFDNDGIKDSEDKCPDIFGLKNNFGCPLREKTRKADRTNELETLEILTTTHCKYVFKYILNYHEEGTVTDKAKIKGNLVTYKNNKEMTLASNIYLDVEKGNTGFILTYPIKNGILYTKNIYEPYIRFEVDTINNTIDTSVRYIKQDILDITKGTYLYVKKYDYNCVYIDLFSNKVINDCNGGKMYIDCTKTNSQFSFSILSDKTNLREAVLGTSYNKENLPILTDKKYTYISLLNIENGNGYYKNDLEIQQEILALIEKQNLRKLPEYLNQDKTDEKFIIACLNARGVLEILGLFDNSKTNKTEIKLITQFNLIDRKYSKLRRLLIKYPFNNDEIRKAINEN